MTQYTAALPHGKRGKRASLAIHRWGSFDPDMIFQPSHGHGQYYNVSNVHMSITVCPRDMVPLKEGVVRKL